MLYKTEVTQARKFTERLRPEESLVPDFTERRQISLGVQHNALNYDALSYTARYCSINHSTNCITTIYVYVLLSHGII